MNFNPNADQSQETLRELVGAMQSLSAASDMPSVRAVVCSAARQITGADAATYILRDGKQCHYAEEDSIEPLWKGSYVPIDECISGWSMIYRQAVTVADIELDDRLSREMYESSFVRSVAMVPVRSTGPIGAVGVYWDHPHTPSKAEMSGLQALADAAAVTLENSSLNSYVLHDSLTSLYNRRGFFTRGVERISSNRDREMATCVLFAALNGIQDINEALGHEAGDEAIRHAGSALQSTCGVDAVIGRIAGNVFAVCGSDETLPSYEAEALEQAVLDAMPGSTELLGLTIGVARAGAGDAFDLDMLVAAANRAMYERRHGRPPSAEDQISRSVTRA